jgi:hypothetical protein
MAHLSDSKAQMIAEKLIIEGLETYLGISSGSLQTKRIMLDDVVSVEIDGYSNEYRIMVEVFARIGKLAPAHYEKLASDLLKLKLVEDILKVPHKKYIAVCGEDVERYLCGSSWKALAVKYYGFEIVRIELSLDDREMILNAQQRQKEGMKL